jgi:hypothetical protein
MNFWQYACLMVVQKGLACCSKCCSIGSLTTAVDAILYTVVYFVLGGLCMTHHARCSYFTVFVLGVVGSRRDLVPQPLLAQQSLLSDWQCGPAALSIGLTSTGTI